MTTPRMSFEEVAQFADEVERFINYWQAESLDEALSMAREYDAWLASTDTDYTPADEEAMARC